MVKISKKTEYALIALRHIVDKEIDELTSAKEISESYSTPFDATSRVLQVLASHGWLKSEQGAHGGYKSRGNLNSLSMKKLCEIIEGPQTIVKCLGEGGSSKCVLEDTCNMISPLANLNHLLVGFLDDVSVMDLIVERSNKKVFSDTASTQL